MAFKLQSKFVYFVSRSPARAQPVGRCQKQALLPGEETEYW